VKAALLALVVALAAGCEAPSVSTTFVVLENDYPAPSGSSGSSGMVIYESFWEAATFSTPIPPGSSSTPMVAVPASANTAYVLLAPGWDPTSTTPPTRFVVLESKQGYGVDVSNTVDIPVSDATFTGNCAAGSFLTQVQADFLTQIVFSSVFAGFRYDAATCTTTPIGDARAD
jgi:hypothetical protein